MAFKFSTELRKQQCFTGSLKTILDGCVLRIYSGAVPYGADSALAGQTLLCEITAGGSGLTFEPASTSPTLMKTMSELWQGDVLDTGIATFFRMVRPSDSGAQTEHEVRIQGTVGGPAEDLTISNATLTQGAVQRVEYFAIALLEHA